jgi:hypothetical protein
VLGLQTVIVAAQSVKPVMVRVVEQPVESTSVSDILVGALGLTGVLVLSAAVLGVVLGGALIGVKLLRARLRVEPPDPNELRVTPGATR